MLLLLASKGGYIIRNMCELLVSGFLMGCLPYIVEVYYRFMISNHSGNYFFIALYPVWYEVFMVTIFVLAHFI